MQRLVLGRGKFRSQYGRFYACVVGRRWTVARGGFVQGTQLGLAHFCPEVFRSRQRFHTSMLLSASSKFPRRPLVQWSLVPLCGYLFTPLEHGQVACTFNILEKGGFSRLRMMVDWVCATLRTLG
jgi:hypothetical protein